jgi:hypothetical protein
LETTIVGAIFFEVKAPGRLPYIKLDKWDVVIAVYHPTAHQPAVKAMAGAVREDVTG